MKNEKPFFLFCIVLMRLLKISQLQIISHLSILFPWCVCVSLCQFHKALITNFFKVSLNIMKYESYFIHFFFLNCFDSPGRRDTLWVYSMWLLEFHVTFRISLSSSTSQVALQYELHGISKSIWGVSKVKSSVVSDSSRPHGLQPTRLLRPWDFPGKSTGVGCHCPLQNKRINADKPKA